MKKFPRLLAVLLLAFTLVIQAKEAATVPHYLDLSKVDLKALLPDPPADGSPATLKEIDLILQDQQTRTPDEVVRIKREVHLNVYLFDTVLGSWFTAKEMPLTAALFKNVDADVYPLIESAKKDWHRPRPPLQDKRVHPPVDLPKNDSYPSGHSTTGNLDALILAELAPDLKDPILARGRQIGDDRVIAGVHFPSDIAAGETLANDLFTRFMANPEFQADLAKAKAEMAAARAKHESPHSASIFRPRDLPVMAQWAAGATVSWISEEA